MGDRSELLPPSTGTFGSATPSGLTPNTRSEAEAALTLNTIAQTDSAAPTTPLARVENMNPHDQDDTVDEAVKAYRRPAGPIRTSSANYEKALEAFRKQSSASTASTDHSHDARASTENVSGAPTVASPTSTVPFPPPGQGVVPLHTGVGTGQAEVIKKARPSGLSLGQLGRQQSWNEQDFKHIRSASLMGEVTGDAGYGSGSEKK
ncbi:hypothetical protein BDV96DRAFT_618633 [Lophiotrema nucula]|uniref:Uncharacterized protein n=1 Tax=Lophiotrema nucula TaxID=690887 RepID=A0A6A5ZVU8_9PLEO|nr:hypothetical protein BDV96DRAFT_618633 [Lophiotrema nucula]